MLFLTGTSGFSYKEWRGVFYPPGMSPDAMLSHYAGRLNAVEINNTFYRLPKPALLESWAGQVPESFRFSIKASRRITHMKRLRNAESETEYLFRTVATLGERLGVLFFQLPPFLAKDVERLDRFAAGVPKTLPAAFQFKHPSWQDPEVIQVLARHQMAWCITDEDEPDPPVIATAPFGYFRLRREQYSEAELKGWLGRIAAQPWERAFVFFKDDEKALGPGFAETFLRLHSAG
jgi:uncharacterized protein YecE (DUF72 family)